MVILEILILASALSCYILMILFYKKSQGQSDIFILSTLIDSWTATIGALTYIYHKLKNLIESKNYHSFLSILCLLIAIVSISSCVYTKAITDKMISSPASPSETQAETRSETQAEIRSEVLLATLSKIQSENSLEIPSKNFNSNSEESPASSASANNSDSSLNLILSTNNVSADELIPGKTLIFGKYKREEESIAEPEDIEWLILDREDNILLLISVEGLDSVQYNNEYEETHWGNSYIRNWLNHYFYNTAFSADERVLIQTHTIEQHLNPQNRDCYQGEPTEDNVFLLSVDEYNVYLKRGGIIDDDARERFGYPTNYAIAACKGNTGRSSFWWWLRTSANYNRSACSVSSIGEINYGEHAVTAQNGIVRPAIYVTIE